MHDYNTRNRDINQPKQPHTASALVSVCYKIPQLILKTPKCITDKISTHSLDGFCKYAKTFMISDYRIMCERVSCFVCGN